MAWLWQFKRSNLNDKLGFVSVPNALATLLVAEGSASRVYSMFKMLDRTPPAPPISAVTFTPKPVTTASPADTDAGTLAATGGTAPYTFAVAPDYDDNDSFTVSGNSLRTTKLLAVGDHEVVVVATDSVGSRRPLAITVSVSEAAEPEAEPGPAITGVSMAAGDEITVDSPVGTLVGTLSCSGGTAPFSYELTDDEGGNFRVAGDRVETAVSGLAEGAHSFTVRASDSAMQSRTASKSTTVFAA